MNLKFEKSTNERKCQKLTNEFKIRNTSEFKIRKAANERERHNSIN